MTSDADMESLKAQLEQLQAMQAKLMTTLEAAEAQKQAPVAAPVPVPATPAPVLEQIPPAPQIQQIPAVPQIEQIPPVAQIQQIPTPAAPVAEAFSVPVAPLEPVVPAVPSVTTVPPLPPVPSLPEAVPAAVKAAVIEAAPVSDAGGMPDLMVLGGAVAFIPLAFLGVNAFVGMISGGDEPKPFNAESKAMLEKLERERAEAGGASGGNTGRSAPDIFAKGLENLGAEPFGWFYGAAPSALYSNQPTEPAVPAPRQMGAKELARKSAAAAAFAFEAAPPPMQAVPPPMQAAPPPMQAVPPPMQAVPPPMQAVPPPSDVPLPPPSFDAPMAPPSMEGVVTPMRPATPPPLVPEPIAVAAPAPVAVAPPEASAVAAPQPVAVAAPAPSVPQPDAAARLAQLAELLQDGLISREEHDQKLAAILEEI